MKKRLAFSLVSGSTLIPFVLSLSALNIAHADTAALLTAPPANIPRMYVDTTPGNFHQIETNVTAVALAAMNQAGVTQKEDKDYVLNAVNEIHEAYVAYAKQLVSEDLLKLETNGMAGNTTPIEDFMKVTGQLKAAKLALESLMTAKAAINKDSLPSAYTVTADQNGKQQAVPSPGFVQLDKVIAKYKSLIQEQMDPQLAQYTHIKIDVYGQPLEISQYKSILNPDFSALPSMNVDTFKEKSQKINELRAEARIHGSEEIKSWGDATRNEYNTFINNWGLEYVYVAREDDPNSTKPKGWMDSVWDAGQTLLMGRGKNHGETGKGNTPSVAGMQGETSLEARNKAFQRMVDGFAMRSYIRKSTGHQLCALQPKLVKASNTLGFAPMASLKELRTEMACTRNELEEALKNTRNILVASGIQADHVFGGDGFLDAGLINKLGSAVTFVKGERSVAEAVNMLVQLIYLDIQEDLSLATGNQGIQKVREMYRERYQSTDEQKLYYTKLRCAIDFDEESCGSVSDAYTQNVGVGMSDNDIMAIIPSIKTALALSQDYVDQAQRIEEALNAARAGNQSNKNLKMRKSDD